MTIMTMKKQKKRVAIKFIYNCDANNQKESTYMIKLCK